MATLTIKNLPDELYAALTSTAKKNRRSLNNEAIVRLEQSLDRPSHAVDDLVEDVRKFRGELRRKGVYLTDEILEQSKKERR